MLQARENKTNQREAAKSTQHGGAAWEYANTNECVALESTFKPSIVVTAFQKSPVKPQSFKKHGIMFFLCVCAGEGGGCRESRAPVLNAKCIKYNFLCELC